MILFPTHENRTGDVKVERGFPTIFVANLAIFRMWLPAKQRANVPNLREPRAKRALELAQAIIGSRRADGAHRKRGAGEEPLVVVDPR